MRNVQLLETDATRLDNNLNNHVRRPPAARERQALQVLESRELQKRLLQKAQSELTFEDTDTRALD